MKGEKLRCIGLKLIKLESFSLNYTHMELSNVVLPLDLITLQTFNEYKFKL